MEIASHHDQKKKCTTDCQLTSIIDLAELCQLRDLYRKDWPQHCVGYYCLDNFINWLRLKPDIKNLKIFTLNGDWRSEGLFLIIDRYQLFMNSLNISETHNEQLKTAISLLDWSIGYKVSSIRQYHRNTVLDVIKAKQLKLDYERKNLMYYLPCAQALKLNVICPEGYSMRPLEEHHAKCIDDSWATKHTGSLFLIKRLIAWNVNVGIFNEENNELVAWCLRLQGGFLGALQVNAKNRRSGLGAVAVAAMAQKIAQMGQDVMALVVISNTGAHRTFKKLGFTEVDKCCWLRPLPTIPNYDWRDNEE